MTQLLESFRGAEVITVTRRQHAFAGAVVDVLVNVVILNLFVEFADEVVISSFTLSVLTAVLLTAMVGAVVAVEHRVHHYFFETHSWKFAGVLSLWAILFGSKFVMLEVVNFVFGDEVELGHLLEVILIVVAMMIASRLMEALYDSLGTDDAEAAATD
jgi:FlaA1/EpsC-like NDP-sugar epimerase